MENIFEGAKFGDRFLTRDGRVAIVQTVSNSRVWYLTETEFCYVDEKDGYYLESKQDSPWDLISRYQEHIDEDKLDELATDSDYNMSRFKRTNDWTRDDYYKEGFKEGYRKAKEE